MKALWLLLCLCAQSYGASLVLAWDRSTDPTVVGYELYYGSAHSIYTNVINVGNQLTNRVSGLVAGVTYFFAARSYNVNGVLSDFSNEISGVPSNPPPPQLFLEIPIMKRTNLNEPFLPYTNLQFALPPDLQSNAFFQFGLSISGKFYRPQGVPGFIPPRKTKALPPSLPASPASATPVFIPHDKANLLFSTPSRRK